MVGKIDLGAKALVKTEGIIGSRESRTMEWNDLIKFKGSNKEYELLILQVKALTGNEVEDLFAPTTTITLSWDAAFELARAILAFIQKPFPGDEPAVYPQNQ